MNPTIISGRHQNNNRELRYLLQFPRSRDFNPADTKPDRLFPLLLLLHGSGGHVTLDPILGGVEENIYLNYVDPNFDYQFFILAPRLPTNSEGVYPWRWGDLGEEVIQIIDQIIASYPVDPDRIYLGGFSMGGHGTWAIACQYPDRFAALVPAAGGGNPDELEKIKHLPVWVFHGRYDPVVLMERSRQMVDRLLALDAEVNFTIFSGVHTLEESIFAEGTLRWLLKQNRRENQRKNLEREIAQQERKKRLATRPFTAVFQGTPNLDMENDTQWEKTPVLTTSQKVMGENAACARFRLLWDKSHLYIQVEVTDNRLSAVNRTDSEQDSVEFMLDFFNTKGKCYDPGCAQYRVNYENRRSGRFSSPMEAFLSSARIIPGGYVVTTAIPFPEELKPRPGITIGFDLQVNDDPGSGKREGIRTWSDEKGQGWTDPTGFGNLLLL